MSPDPLVHDTVKYLILETDAVTDKLISTQAVDESAMGGQRFIDPFRMYSTLPLALLRAREDGWIMVATEVQRHGFLFKRGIRITWLAQTEKRLGLKRS